MDGRKRSLNLVGSGQDQRPPVLFCIKYKFENISISFNIIKTQKIEYTVPTLVLTRVCLNMGDIMSTPQPLSPSYQSHIASVE